MSANNFFQNHEKIEGFDSLYEKTYYCKELLEQDIKEAQEYNIHFTGAEIVDSYQNVEGCHQVYSVEELDYLFNELNRLCEEDPENSLDYFVVTTWKCG